MFQMGFLLCSSVHLLKSDDPRQHRTLKGTYHSKLFVIYLCKRGTQFKSNKRHPQNLEAHVGMELENHHVHFRVNAYRLTIHHLAMFVDTT
jgi:hypothetical protein